MKFNIFLVFFIFFGYDSKKNFGKDTTEIRAMDEEKNSIIKERKFPPSYDARKEGLVNPVQNQGDCGACFAFSAIANIEAQFKRTYGVLERFSPQQIMDCAPGLTCHLGGHFYDILDYFSENKYIYKLKDYPYNENDDKTLCKNRKEKAINFEVEELVSIYETDIDTLKYYIYTEGPLMASIAYKDSGLSNYKGGILQEAENCKPDSWPDHAVNLVGYGNENGIDYWIVRNSMGSNYGEDGYFRIKAGINLCQIEAEAYYFKIKKVNYTYDDSENGSDYANRNISFKILKIELLWIVIMILLLN